MKDFRVDMIKNTRKVNKICEQCTMSTYRFHPEDDLDAYKGELLKIYE